MSRRAPDRLASFRVESFTAGMQGLLFGRRQTSEQLRRYQIARLRALVDHADREVPFYHELYQRYGVSANAINELEDLERLPIVSRRDLQGHSPKNLLARGLRPSTLEVHSTSGSTGEPLRVWRTRSEEWLLAAFRLRSLLRFGMRPGEKLASVQFMDEKARPFRAQKLPWRWLFPHTEIYCLLDIREILQWLSHIRPVVLAGLPPILDQICEEVGGGGWPQIRPQRIVTGAEILTAGVRGRLERQFGVPVYDRYSAVECRLIASSCPSFPERFHFCGDAVLAEVQKDGRPAGPGEEGEILVTALHSYAMPFIRYRLGDLVRLEDRSCPCGSPHMAISSICGRIVDRLLRADGSEAHIPIVIQVVPELAPWIRRFQIVQRLPGQVIIEVLSADDPGPAGVSESLRRLTERVGGLEVRFDFHPEQTVEATGKFRIFRSEIRGQQAEPA